MQEITIKANNVGAYDVFIDGVAQHDIQALSITYDVDKDIHPEIITRRAMFTVSFDDLDALNESVKKHVISKKESTNESTTKDI